MATTKKVESGRPKLPLEIIREILAWLPVETLRRFDSVYDPWRSLIRDPRFVKLHYDKASAHDDVLYQRRRLLIRNTRWGHSSINLDDFLNRINLDDYGNSVVSIDDTSSLVNLSGFIGTTLYCHGLLFMNSLFHAYHLFNPATCEMKKLPYPPDIYSSGDRNWLYGFGFDVSTLDYKVVRGEVVEDDDDLRFCVYSLKADSWRVLPSGYPYKYLQSDKKVRQVNGGVHWLVRRVEDRSAMAIISFLLAEEEVREIPLPPEFSVVEDGAEYYLNVFEDCLCMGKEHDLAFWVMKEYGVAKSWTKVSISVPFWEELHSGFVRKNHHLLLLEDQPDAGSKKKKRKNKKRQGFVMYNFDEQKFFNLSIPGLIGQPQCVQFYLESIVSPNNYGKMD